MGMNKRYNKELLEPLVQQSKSVSQVARLLGLTPCGGSVTHLRKAILREGIDISHFTGQAWNKRKTAINRKSNEEFLVAGYTRRPKAHIIRRCLVAMGVKYKCSRCPIENEHNGKPIILEVDHINNDWTDNRLPNLQFLCPNCHSQKTKEDGSVSKYKATRAR